MNSNINHERNSIGDKYFNRLNTASGSILHYLFNSSFFYDYSQNKFKYLKSFWFIGIVTFWIPLLIAFIHFPFSEMIHRTEGIKLPYLWDFNAIYGFFFVVPFIITFMINERYFVPKALSSVFTGSSSIVKQWEKYFLFTNILGQTFGVLVGIMIHFFNYKTLITDGQGYWGASNEIINLPGIVMLYWQIPFFAWCLTLYVVRYFTYILMLTSFSRKLPINIMLFHHDKCSGLKMIGEIGYRNQYILMILFINFITMILSLKLWRPEESIYIQTAVLMAINLILGPLIFFGPLIPFREKLLELKSKDLVDIGNRITQLYQELKKNFTLEKIDKTSYEQLYFLEELRNRIDKVAVWPFDASSLKKFFAAYLAPVVPIIVSVMSILFKAWIEKYFL